MGWRDRYLEQSAGGLSVAMTTGERKGGNQDGTDFTSLKLRDTDRG